MAKLESRDYLQFSNTQVLNIIYDEFESYKTTYIRKAYDDLKEIVNHSINTTANFMYSFVEENLDLVMKDIFKRSYERIEDDLVGMTNITCYQLDAAEDIDEVNRIVDNYKDFIENETTYKVNLDELSNEFTEYLGRYITSRFGSYDQRSVENAVDDIKYETRMYLNRMVENIYQEIHGLVVRVNIRQKDALKHYVAEYKRLAVKKQNPDNKYTEGLNNDTFSYNGNNIVYQYDERDYNCYVDGVKINDPSKIMEINRKLQEEFPEAQPATDAMVRRVSTLLMDSQQQEKEKGVPSFADLLKERSQSTEVTEIPEWLQEMAQPKNPKDDLNNLSLDDYLEEPRRESTSEEKKHIQDLMDALEIKDDPEPVRTPEEKAHIQELTDTLEIKDDPEPVITQSNPAETQRMLDMIEIKDDEPVNVINEPSRITEEELQDIFNRLDIPDDTLVKESTPEEKQRIADLTASLDIKDDEPESVSPCDENDYLEYKDRIEAYQEYLDQFGDKIQEAKKQEQQEPQEQQEAMPLYHLV